MVVFEYRLAPRKFVELVQSPEHGVFHYRPCGLVDITVLSGKAEEEVRRRRGRVAEEPKFAHNHLSKGIKQFCAALQGVFYNGCKKYDSVLIGDFLRLLASFLYILLEIVPSSLFTILSC